MKKKSSHNWFNDAWMRRWMWEAKRQQERRDELARRKLYAALDRWWYSTWRWN